MKFVAFDLETTGFLPGVDRIVEVGAVRFVDGEVDAVFSTLVNPERAIPAGASAVNGITDDMVLGKPKIEELLGPLTEFCGDDVMVAHNAPFDFQFLVSEYKRFETPAPRGLVLCTFLMAKKIYPGLANYKLGTLVQHLNIDSKGFHRAEADATYAAQLYLKMIERMTGSVSAWPPLENLVAMTGKAECRFPVIEPQPKQLDLLDLL
ncbi:MAG TPA: 3'-5' exonuclease [Bdellovibrionales bacterium]|nr:3'-5' exonuclease [Bdellovibrionales bacterium]